VLVLTNDNFAETIANNEFVLVEFYAPWCGHCKRLAPEYARAATILKGRDSPAKLAKLDATVHGATSSKFGVSGYPTLKFFRNGEAQEYDGGRVEAEIVSWISKKTMPVSRHLTTQEEIDAFTASSATRIVAYVSSSDEAAWTKVAANGKFEGLIFGHVTDSSLFGDKNSGTIDIHKDGQVISDSGANEALLALIHRTRIQQRPKVFSDHWSNWLLETAFPLVDKWSDLVQTRAAMKKRDTLVVFGDSDNVDTAYAANQIAQQYKDTVVVAISDKMDVATSWGSSGQVTPVAVLITSSKKQATKVVWNEDTEGAFDTETLTAFVDAARAGTYSSFVKSEPIPTEKDGHVTVLVGKTLPDAIKSGKDVFVEFYAPWCGHCKNLVPIWEELAAAYDGDDSVVIAKLDATANKVPENINVKGFPTLIFFNAKGKQVSYGGERQFADLQKFVEAKRAKVVPKKEEKSEL